MLKNRTISHKLTDEHSKKEIIRMFTEALETMERGHLLVVTLSVSEVERRRRQYFAMVRELGIFAGYSSTRDKQIFKEQIREQLNVESIADITSEEEMISIIESLHELAAKHYDYVFRGKPGEGDFKIHLP